MFRKSRSIVSLGVVLSILAMGYVSALAQGLTIGLNFTGTNLFQSGFIPPDTMGAVGPDHIVELLNGRYVVYDKSNGNQVEASSLDQFWTDAGVNFVFFTFDPRILFDPFEQRWYATAVDNPDSDNSFLVAVSNSADPTEGWTGFALDSDSTDLRWADFPTMGFNRDGLFISANMFGITGRGAGFAITFVVIPKDDLLAAAGNSVNVSVQLGELTKNASGLSIDLPKGNQPTRVIPLDTVPEELSPSEMRSISNPSKKENGPNAISTVNVTKFENLSFGITGDSVQPIVDLNNQGLPIALLSDFSINASQFKRSNIEGPIDNPTLDTSDGLITVDIFASKGTAEQPGPKNDIDSGDDRFSSNVVLQNGFFWGTQTVSNNGRNAIRWFRIDANTNTLEEEGIISDSELEFYYSSIAVNEFGHVVIGFSGSNDQQFISTYAVLGETSSGVTTFGDPLLLKAGVSDYQILDGIGRNRWGDYSATVVDPSDPLSFWTFQEFVSDEDVWAIQTTQLIVGDQQEAPHVIDFEGIPNGTVVSEVFSNNGFGPIKVEGELGSNCPYNAAVIFDSNCPGDLCTGSDRDSDLGTPNETFAGPGIGEGGEMGSPWANETALGNLLIVHENCDDLENTDVVDTPNDTEEHSRVTLEFPKPVKVISYTILDNDAKETDKAKFFGENGDQLDTSTAPITGNNGKAVIPVNVEEVTKIVFDRDGSRGLDNIVFSVEENDNENGRSSIATE